MTYTRSCEVQWEILGGRPEAIRIVSSGPPPSDELRQFIQTHTERTATFAREATDNLRLGGHGGKRRHQTAQRVSSSPFDPTDPPHVIGNPDSGVALLAAPQTIAFDGAGNLWVGVCGDEILRFAAADLASSGPTPDLVIDGAGCVRGIAFGPSGMLGVATANGAYVIDPGDLAQSGTAARRP